MSRELVVFSHPRLRVVTFSGGGGSGALKRTTPRSVVSSLARKPEIVTQDLAGRTKGRFSNRTRVVSKDFTGPGSGPGKL